VNKKVRKGKAEQDRQTGHQEQYRQDRTGKTGQAVQDKQNGKGRMGQTERDRQKRARTGRTGRQNGTGRTVAISNNVKNSLQKWKICIASSIRKRYHQ
jgi:hypothetical protein